ncbi:MAG: DEAD/DEAH box helicase [Oligosphaeraceae bacterium]|nr:DEAD/DEAH box helicase [Oligosphaeraceae bacterium]
MTFQELRLHDNLLPLIQRAGYTEPTPIQAQTIPLLLSKQDVLGLAPTGTGKTAAFVLPILQLLQKPSTSGIRCLVIAPTRELAEQIHNVFVTFSPAYGLRSAVVYGGVSANPQVRSLKQGLDILVACPGRLLDHLQQKNLTLNNLEILVLDEADHLFDMGFLPNIRAIVAQTPRTRQTLLFSATMPMEVKHLALEVLRQPQTVDISKNLPVSTVSHALYPVQQHLKTKLLLTLLKGLQSDSVIVFTRTKFRAKRVSEQLCKSGFLATPLQGNMSQNRRQESLDGFRDGTFQILVATDIAARGIDVTSVSHVINYDIPDTVEAYTHRIGRTGRALQTGEAFTFCTNDDQAEIAAVERRLGYRIERKMLPAFDYNEKMSQEHRQEFSRPPLGGQHRRRSSAADSAARPERSIAHPAPAARPNHRSALSGRRQGVRH